MRPYSILAVTALAATVLWSPACTSGNSGNAAPRLAPVPPQRTTGGAFTLDLGPYATDREGGTLVFDVVSGGGSFAGSVYSNTFDTMGSYGVVFRVTDPEGKFALGTFEVDVTAATFLVDRQDQSGLALIDAATAASVQIAAGTATPSLAAGLADGRLCYQIAHGTGTQLWLFDPMTRKNTRIAENAANDVLFRAKTSTGSLVFTTGSAADTDLYLFETATGMLREISAQAGEVDGNPMVNAEDLVFYERGSLGQADIWYYDPEALASTAVSTAPTDERLLAVLPDGGAVFSRVGAAGETDLFYFRRGSGLVEIAGNSASLVGLDKSYAGTTTDSRVVFTAMNGADREIHCWNPADGQTTAIATGAVYGVEAIAAGNELVYRRDVSASERDLYFRDLDTGVTATVRDSTDVSQFLAVTGASGTNWAIVQGGGSPTAVDAVSLAASPTIVTLTGAAAEQFQAVLPNGDVVVRTADGARVDVFDVSAGSWSGFAGVGISYAGPGVDAGDFVYSETAGGDADLYLWDASASTSVPVSTAAGTDLFQCAAAGRLFFTNDGSTHADLFVFDPATSASTQVTGPDGAGQSHDHTVLGTYVGSR
ncbi:MAG: hypothetical protein Fur0037_04670 [Planctomycetota bacterium]